MLSDGAEEPQLVGRWTPMSLTPSRRPVSDKAKPAKPNPKAASPDTSCSPDISNGSEAR